MGQRAKYALAIETSSHTSAIAIGTDGKCLDIAVLPQKRRHQLSLVPSMSQLLEKHCLTPQDLASLHVSVGPGSFTGLRMAVSVARMLAVSTGVQLVAVPTLEVLLAGINTKQVWVQQGEPVCIAMNTKQIQAYGGIFQWDNALAGWQAQVAARPMDLLQAVEAYTDKPLHLLCEKVHPQLAEVFARQPMWNILPSDDAQPKVEHVWALGEALSAAGRYVSADELLPLYARQPEAVTLWEKRKA